jgi:hypothetical protein
MSPEPTSTLWTVREQTVEDPTSGLTLHFELSPDGQPILRVVGERLPCGNREIRFDAAGWEEGAETCVGATDRH